MKLNGDGSVTNDVGCFGGIIRNNVDDTILAFTGADHKKNVEVQELNAVLWGLQGCLMVQEKKVAAASGSLRDILILEGKEHVFWYCSNLVLHLRSLAAKCRIVKFPDVYRETNRATDYPSFSCNEPTICSFASPQKLHSIVTKYLDTIFVRT